MTEPANTLGIISTATLLGALRRLTPHQALIANELWPRRWRGASFADLTDAIWGDDPDGGPEDPALSVRLQIHHLRAKGVPIKLTGPGRYALLPTAA